MATRKITYLQVSNTGGTAGQVLVANGTAVTWGDANNTAYLGGTAAAGYQTTAGLSANVATLTANNTSYVGSVTAANVVSNSQLSSNLANYQTTAGLSANVATLAANSATYLGGSGNFGNTTGIYTSGIINAASHTVGSSFIANNTQLTIATPVSANGGVGTAGQVLTSNGATGSPYWTTSSAGVNVAAQYVWTNTHTFANNVTINNDKRLFFQTTNTSAYSAFVQQPDDNFVFYTTNTSYGTRAVYSIYANTNNSEFSFQVPVRFNSNVTVLVANGSQGSPGQLLASDGTNVYWVSPGAASVNTASQFSWTNTHTFSANVNFTGNNITVVSNTGSVMFAGAGDTNWRIARNSGATTKWKYSNNTIDILAANSNLEGVVIGNPLSSGASYFETGHLGTYIASNATIGNSSSNATINSTAYTGSANNASYLGGVAAASYVNSSQLSSNLANYAALAGATFTGDVIVNANLIVSGTTVTVNTATLDVKDLNITVAKGAASAALADGAGITVDTASIGWYYHNASNTWQSNVGITPSANATYNLGSATLQWANVYAKAIYANGSLGVAGQVLATNGSAIYWTADQGSNAITSNTLTSNYVSVTTGTLSVGNSTVNTDIGNNYVSVGNSTGYVNVYSNRIYLGNTSANATINSTVYTGSANNASYLGGVAAANYVNTSGNYTLSGNTTFSANLIIAATGEIIINAAAGISANGTFGTAGQLLTSNGSAVYWSTTSTGVNLASSYAFTNTTASGNATSGAITTAGGLGVANNIYAGGRIGWSNSTNVSVVYQQYNATTGSLDVVFG